MCWSNCMIGMTALNANLKLRISCLGVVSLLADQKCFFFSGKLLMCLMSLFGPVASNVIESLSARLSWLSLPTSTFWYFDQWIAKIKDEMKVYFMCCRISHQPSAIVQAIALPLLLISVFEYRCARCLVTPAENSMNIDESAHTCDERIKTFRPLFSVLLVDQNNNHVGHRLWKRSFKTLWTRYFWLTKSRQCISYWLIPRIPPNSLS